MISIKKILRMVRKYLKNVVFDICTKHNPKKISKDSIIIIRTDSIGDYLLFRNFITEIRLSYPNYSITLLGNIIWKNLSESFDNNHIDKFIWIDRNKFLKKYLHTILTLRKIQSISYDILINPLQSRDETSEFVVKYIFANSKYTTQGDCINLQLDAKAQADSMYTRLLPSSQSILFEFHRNQEFFEHFLNKKLSTKLCIESKINTQNQHIVKLSQGRYAVIFIGANAVYRRWSIEHFSKVVLYLLIKMNVVICGGIEDLQQAKLLESIVNKNKSLENDSNMNLINIAGHTTLSELAQIVQNASMLVSNETGCAHLGAIMDIPTFVISNGNHLGRFTPYPKSLQKKYYAIYPKSIMHALYDEKTYLALCQDFAFRSHLQINEINPDDVINVISSCLAQQI